MAHPCWLYAVDLGDGRLTLRWTPVPEADLAYWAQRGAARLVWARRPVSAREAWEAVQGGADPCVAEDGDFWVRVSGLRPEAGRGEAAGLACLRRAARAAHLARLAERVAARLAGRSLLWTELMALADRRAWADLWREAAVARGDGVR
ncbi:MAG TPA: hypothetical protein VIK75_00850, partial [Calditerricola sp.]